MPGTDWDERRELTWLLTEEARSATDRIAAELRAMESSEKEPGRDAIDALRGHVRALQASLAQLHDVHGVVPMVNRTERVRLDALSIAGEVAQECTAEGIPVRVESRTSTGSLYADPAELRRILRLMIERAVNTSEGSRGGWIVLKLSVTGGEVVFEVPWADAVSAADAAEREWLQRAVRRQAGVLTTVGAVARVVLSSSARDAEGQAEALEREVEAMRRRAEHYILELDAARRQGEAYARDLADLFAEVEARDASLAGMAVRWERATRAVSAITRELRRALGPVARQTEALTAQAGDNSGTAAEMLQHLRAAGSALKRLKEYFDDGRSPSGRAPVRQTAAPPDDGNPGPGSGHVKS